MNSCTERLKNGIITENPTFVMMLGCVRRWLLLHQPSTVWAWV